MFLVGKHGIDVGGERWRIAGRSNTREGEAYFVKRREAEDYVCLVATLPIALHTPN